MSQNKGFTLIELIMVVAIMGILFSLAYSSYSNHYNRINLLGSVDKMKTQMNWARNYAIRREKFCVVSIWPSDGKYQFAVKNDPDDGEEVPITVGPPGEILTDDTVLIGNNIEIGVIGCDDDDPCVLTYNYLTEEWDKPAVKINFSLSGQPSQTLGIDASTGRVNQES